MNPADYAKSGTEHAEQVALFMWAANVSTREPRLKKMFAIPNGGERNKAVAANLKAEGVKSGVPDICLPVVRWQGPKDTSMQYAGLYLELKKRKGGVLSPAQKAWHEDLTAEGYFVATCPGWEDARDCLKWYLEREDL